MCIRDSTYGLYEKTENTRFLVFDLGGGTFDVSILELAGPILDCLLYTSCAFSCTTPTGW